MPKTKAQEFISSANAIIDIAARQTSRKHGLFIANMLITSLFSVRQLPHESCRVPHKHATYLRVEFEDASKAMLPMIAYGDDGCRTYDFKNVIFE